MAKKTHVKVRLVPETKPNSPFFYYVKKPSGGEKAKVKLKAKKYNPATRKHEIFVEKKLPLGKSGYVDFSEKRVFNTTLFSQHGNKMFLIIILLYIFLIFSFNRIS